jgi:heme oxygenase (biliverdin-IX-beta and delta-forming)
VLLSVDRMELEIIRTAVATLRDRTADTHERLHGHPVFIALLSGRIDRAGYVDLLLGLFGFHKPFEHVVAEGPVRCQRLIEDLKFLGVDREEIDRAPCAASPAALNDAERWGVDYVLRGATLGGRVLARKLDNLLGRAKPDGRRFLTDGGESSGTRWHSFVEQLELSLPTQIEREAAAAAAVATFDQFEKWMTHIVASRPPK